MSWFNQAYESLPPWDIGRPQPEIIRLAEAGEIEGLVLDVGCGTGENSLFLAERGHKVWGVDSAALAIRKARQKARERGVNASFILHDALNLSFFGQNFDTVIDSGMFHTLSDAERKTFVKSVAGVLRAGGSYLMLCFSDKEPDNGGPRRISEAEIRSTFQNGWKLNYIRETRFESNLDHQPRAWIVSMTRI